MQFCQFILWKIIKCSITQQQQHTRHILFLTNLVCTYFFAEWLGKPQNIKCQFYSIQFPCNIDSIFVIHKSITCDIKQEQILLNRTGWYTPHCFEFRAVNVLKFTTKIIKTLSKYHCIRMCDERYEENDNDKQQQMHRLSRIIFADFWLKFVCILISM